MVTFSQDTAKPTSTTQENGTNNETKTNTKLQLLRVQQAEINSGNLNGRVYEQASPGAAFFLADRSTLRNQINEKIYHEIENDALDK